MPELRCGAHRSIAERGENLLDALHRAGQRVPFSCRAGSCQVCKVRCIEGEPIDLLPDALDAVQRREGWRLACQCRVDGDLHVEPFSPERDGQPACVEQAEWLAGEVLRLRLSTVSPVRYRPGQHAALWTPSGLARRYSMASVPGEESGLEFHIDCSRPGAFASHARTLSAGDRLLVADVQGGPLAYEPEWDDQPLLLLGGGTGLAPLWSVARYALAKGQVGPIRLVHVAQDAYLREPMMALAASHPSLSVEWLDRSGLAHLLAQERRMPRRTIALVCGSEGFVDACVRGLYLAGLPRNQVRAECFVSGSGTGA